MADPPAPSARFGRATTGTMAASAAQLVLGVALSVVVARLLGPTGRGQYALLVLLPGTAVALAELGVGSATVYLVAGRQFAPGVAAATNRVLAGVLGLVGLVGGLAVVWFAGPSLFPGVPRELLVVALAAVPCLLYFRLGASTLHGIERFTPFNVLSVAHAATLLAATAVALGLWPRQVAAALGAWVAASLVSAVSAEWTVRRTVGMSPAGPDLGYVRSALGYGVRTHLGVLVTYLSYRIDQFLVIGFLGPAALGFYAVAVGLTERLWVVSQAASTVLLPHVARSGPEGGGHQTAVVARTVLWLTIPPAAVIAWAAGPVVRVLYSAEFLPAVTAVRLLAVGVVALALSRVLANDLAARGHPLLNSLASLAALVLNVALNLLWIPRFGIAGAAAASAVSYTVTLATRLYFFARFTGTPLGHVLVPQRGDLRLYGHVLRALRRS